METWYSYDDDSDDCFDANASQGTLVWAQPKGAGAGARRR